MSVSYPPHEQQRLTPKTEDSNSADSFPLEGHDPSMRCFRLVEFYCGSSTASYIFRFVLLILSGSGYYYALNGPQQFAREVKHGSIRQAFAERGEEYTQGMDHVLHLIYRWPSAILPALGGVLIDRFFGISGTMAICCGVLVIYSVVQLIGIESASFAALVVGQAFFSLVGETLCVCQICLILRLFGSGRSLFLGFGWGFFGWHAMTTFSTFVTPAIGSSSWGVMGPEVLQVTVVSLAFGVSLLCRFLETSAFHRGTIDIPSHKLYVGATLGAKLNPFPAFFAFPRVFWPVAAACVTGYVPILGFLDFAADYISCRYGVSSEDATNDIGMTFLCTTLASAIFGAVLYYVGRPLYSLSVSMVAILGLHIALYINVASMTSFTIIFGAFYALFAVSIWPSVLIISKENAGLAVGLLTALQNFTLALVGIVNASLTKNKTSAEYVDLSKVFICFAAIAFVFSLTGVVVDRFAPECEAVPSLLTVAPSTSPFTAATPADPLFNSNFHGSHTSSSPPLSGGKASSSTTAKTYEESRVRIAAPSSSIATSQQHRGGMMSEAEIHHQGRVESDYGTQMNTARGGALPPAGSSANSGGSHAGRLLSSGLLSPRDSQAIQRANLGGIQPPPPPRHPYPIVLGGSVGTFYAPISDDF